jgi:NADPH:quinone reductase-like Zn-dependent oxidoreductase
MVGGDVFKRSQAALAEGGRLVSVGRASGLAPEPDALLAESKRQEITTGWLIFVIKPPAELARDLAKILDLVREGTLKAVVDRVFPLSEAAAAMRHLEGRNQFGKVILRP